MVEEKAFFVEFNGDTNYNEFTVKKHGVTLTLNYARNFTPFKLKNFNISSDSSDFAEKIIEVCMDRLLNIDTVYTSTDKLFTLITSEPKWYAGKFSKQHASQLIKSHKAGTMKTQSYEVLFGKFGYKREEIEWKQES